MLSRQVTSHLIGIAGASGSGKTTLANSLAKSLVDAVVLPIDAYYRDLSHLEPTARELYNFDVPGAFDWNLLVTHLHALRLGETTQLPIYDFITHTRSPTTRLVSPRSFLIVEGLLAFHDPRVLTLLDTTVFLEVNDRIALDRRVARDNRERGRHPNTIHAQYTRDVRPMFERYVRPTADWAMLTLSGVEPIDTLVERITTYVTQASRPPSH